MSPSRTFTLIFIFMLTICVISLNFLTLISSNSIATFTERAEKSYDVTTIGGMMMKQYIADAFTDKIFSGNPAAVCIMDEWLPDSVMQNIAGENNLSETAFAVKNKTNDNYHLRWFTPGGEIDLCGHATLASAFIITEFTEPALTVVKFETLSGLLTVTKHNDIFELDFPSFELTPLEVTDEMTAAIGIKPAEAYIGDDLVLVYDSAATVRNAVPNQAVIAKLNGLGVHITAAGENVNKQDFDCITRSFFPKLSVAEDPVCGRGHCHVVPLWSKKLNKRSITAYQASRRGGELYCRFEGARTILGGKAALFSAAELNL